MKTELDKEAYELTKKLEAETRFSEKWNQIMNEVEAWTKKNNRPLYYTYTD